MFESDCGACLYAVENGVDLFHWCMLKAGDHTRIMLNTEYEEGQRPAVRPPKGDEHFGVWFFYGCPDVDGAYEKLKARVRARVEHPFHVVKNIFKYKKTRYKGLAKNDAQLNVLFALSNLYMVREKLRP